MKNTTEEKIVSIKKDDGSIEYVISWFDETTQRTNFAFVNQNELKSLKKLTSTQLNDDSLIASTFSAASTDFWHGSYVETYGDIITGGVHVYLSSQDAPYVAGLGAAGGILLCMALDGPLPFADEIGVVLGVLIETVYWMEQNSDGSLDIEIPFASAATYAIGGIAFVKIGFSWYML